MRAADILEGLDEDVAQPMEGQLKNIRGIGKAMKRRLRRLRGQGRLRHSRS